MKNRFALCGLLAVTLVLSSLLQGCTKKIVYPKDSDASTIRVMRGTVESAKVTKKFAVSTTQEVADNVAMNTKSAPLAAASFVLSLLDYSAERERSVRWELTVKPDGDGPAEDVVFHLSPSFPPFQVGHRVKIIFQKEGKSIANLTLAPGDDDLTK